MKCVKLITNMTSKVCALHAAGEMNMEAKSITVSRAVKPRCTLSEPMVGMGLVSICMQKFSPKSKNYLLLYFEFETVTTCTCTYKLVLYKVPASSKFKRIAK